VAELAIVVDASVGLKGVLQEADSHLAEAAAGGEDELLVPDFWLNEACNVLWLQVRRNRLTTAEAREGLLLLRALVEPTPTADLHLHDVALELGLAVNHSTYDTLYVAFAIGIGAQRVIAADGPFARAMRGHPDPAVAGLLQSLGEWAGDRGV
jgi:predicted nucleic acid-binding protein